MTQNYNTRYGYGIAPEVPGNKFRDAQGTILTQTFDYLNHISAISITTEQLVAGSALISAALIESLSADKITAGTLTASVLYAGTINASQISVGTITASVAYAGTINASQISAGTITAGVVYAGTINASQISAGTITAAVVYAGSLNASQITAGTLTLTSGMSITNSDGNVTINSTSITIKNASGSSTILDRYGLDTKFIKWFKNMCYNGSFELFNISSIPTYWNGGVSDSNSNFFGTYSMKLTTGSSSIQTTAAWVNSTWYNDMASATRVSFHKKGGATKISVLNGDNADAAFTLTDENGATGTAITYAYNANWVAQSYTVSFAHGSSTQMKVKFENSDASSVSYVDGVIIEPDYTGSRPSFYTDGPYSLANSKGGDITIYGNEQLIVTTTAPANAVEDDVWIDEDDYSRYDSSSLAATATLLASGEEVIFASGTYTITLYTGSTTGMISKIYNIGSGLITLSGTINSATGMYLYPNESVELITDGTNWRY